jgi:TonB family protein
MAQLSVDKKNAFNLIFGFITALHVFLLLQTLAPKNALLNPERQRPIVVKVLWAVNEKKQIVQSEDSTDAQRKLNAFQSDKTRSFIRQTKSSIVGSFKSGHRKLIDLSQLGASNNPFHEGAKSYAHHKKNASKSQQTGISATNDHLPDIPLGELTQLNTVENKYYGFYHRIRQKLEQFWGRSIHQKAQELAKAGRQLATSDEFMTALRVSLDSEGRVIGIEIVGASGVKELDEAAIESFNQAGPFPNPPKDLMVNGKVTLEWGFVVNS